MRVGDRPPSRWQSKAAHLVHRVWYVVRVKLRLRTCGGAVVVRVLVTL